MPNPQQPELRRSGRGAAVEDGAEPRAGEAPEHRGDPLPEHVTPEESRPGHKPDREQDQPDVDRFAERLGLHVEHDDDD